jgi:glycosyltransferase involved in cell wall biosynthesis
MLKCPALTLRVVAERPPNFKQLPADRVEFRRWSPQTEVADIQDLAIGIMPLSDSVVARGKCSFKLLTYMSCGVPVIASPIGMNVDVLAHDSVGLAPISADDWTDALLHLVNDREKRSGMGQRGREVVKLHYSADIIATKLAGFLEKRFL